MFPALCGDPVLGFLMTNWVKNKVQLNNWSMPFRKPSFSKKLKTWKYFKIKWNLTILQLRFCILMAKFGISIKFWSRNMYDDVCMMTFQKCHFLSRIVTKISNCVLVYLSNKDFKTEIIMNANNCDSGWYCLLGCSTRKGNVCYKASKCGPEWKQAIKTYNMGCGNIIYFICFNKYAIWYILVWHYFYSLN